MKIFQTIRESYQILGIYSMQSDRESSVYNSRNLLMILCPLQIFTSSLAYSMFQAKSIGQFADAIFVCWSCVSIELYFWINILKKLQIYALIEKFEEFIEKSEFQHFTYITIAQFNKKVEFLVKFRINGFDFKCHIFRID